MAMGISTGGRRGRRGSRRAPMAEINVTPLVDVMLVLLIIFMVTAPLLTSAVPVDLPDSRASAMDQEPDQITLSIRADGSIYIDNDPVALGTLADRLAAMPIDASGKPPLVTLRADKALDYGLVMAVMGELNHAGFNAISLVTNSSVSAP
ncbi:protein TolR [Croceicoccus estronivorus]|uniref:ExbD/TolR family protein n=1 Tax=Croceicoccus estronivorus TaxID=1172626 RepID=UPI00082F52E0|nr:biopolymer transporter ExbD [Croceicoccus estronivorus]OCC23650.1 protein TolR [Croceicoccus estronivorus]